MRNHLRAIDCRRGLALLCATASALAMYAPAAAQQASDGAVSAGAGEQQEIVVTATRRSANIQDVPFSITAIDGVALEERQVEDFADLVRVVPGVSFATQYRQQSSISIRGATNASDASGVDQAVAVYIDDLPTIGGSELRQDLFDLDRVEILRGPQGTLFGRNVTGGLIAFHTRAPRFDPELMVSGSYGSFDDYRLQGLATGPLTSTVAGKLAVSFNGRNGFVRNVVAGGRSGDTDSVGARAQLLFRPSDTFEVKIGGEYYREEGDAADLQFYGLSQPGSASPAYLLLGESPPQLSYDPDESNTALPGTGSTTAYAAWARIDAEAGPGTLTSISGYRYSNPEDERSNKLGTPLPGVILPAVRSPAFPLGFDITMLIESVAEKNDQFSQEIRYASNDDGPFQWLVGAFYLNLSRDQSRVVETDLDPNPRLSFDSSDLNSYAFFGEANYELVEGFTATLGARYTWESREAQTSFPQRLTDGPQIASTSRASWEAFTPKFTLSYEPRDNLMFYATAAKGFKSGGFDSVIAVASPTSPTGFTTVPYDPETAWNYEVGTKSTLFDGALVANVSLFHQKFKNFQRRIFEFTPCFCYFVNNIDEAKVEGIETELVFRPARWLTLGGSHTYLRSDSSANTKLGAKHAGSLYGRIEQPLGPGTLSLGGDVSFRSVPANALSATPDPSYLRELKDNEGVFNAQLGYEFADGAYRIALWAKNITDHRYITGGSDISAQLAGRNIAGVRWNPPATYGVTLTARWR